MKTYQNLKGEFVTEDPGLENTIFGHDKNNKPIILGSILYSQWRPGQICLVQVDKHNYNFMNYRQREGYEIISAREASILAKTPNTSVYGNYKSKI